MSDLISRQAAVFVIDAYFKKMVESTTASLIPKIAKETNTEIAENIRMVAEVLQKGHEEDIKKLLLETIPTAYDVEAVVRELEEAMALYKTREEACHVVNCGNYAKVHYHGIQQGIKFAIEIVKRGGRND